MYEGFANHVLGLVYTCAYRELIVRLDPSSAGPSSDPVTASSAAWPAALAASIATSREEEVELERNDLEKKRGGGGGGGADPRTTTGSKPGRWDAGNAAAADILGDAAEADAAARAYPIGANRFKNILTRFEQGTEAEAVQQRHTVEPVYQNHGLASVMSVSGTAHISKSRVQLGGLLCCRNFAAQKCLFKTASAQPFYF